MEKPVSFPKQYEILGIEGRERRWWKDDSGANWGSAAGVEIEYRRVFAEGIGDM
jgi:hypothetical protein